MPDFTPGPWSKHFSGDAAWHIKRDGYPVAMVFGGNREIDKANALLIAAAPAMYEALKLAEDRLDYHAEGNFDLDVEAHEATVAALALAEGESDD